MEPKLMPLLVKLGYATPSRTETDDKGQSHFIPAELTEAGIEKLLIDAVMRSPFWAYRPSREKILIWLESRAREI